MSNDELEKQLDNQEDNMEQDLDISDLLNSNDEKESQELEDIINLLNSSEDDLIDLDGLNSEVFEGLSKEELDKITQLDEELNVDEIETDVISSVSVYDEKEVDEDEVLKRMKDAEEEENQEEQDIEKISNKDIDQSLDEVLKTLDENMIVEFF